MDSVFSFSTNAYNLCLTNALLEAGAALVILTTGKLDPVTNTSTRGSLVTQVWAIAILAIAAASAMALCEDEATQVFALKGAVVYHVGVGALLLFQLAKRVPGKGLYLAGLAFHGLMTLCILGAAGSLKI